MRSCSGTCGSATIYCDATGLFCWCQPVAGDPARACTGAGTCAEAVIMDCCRP
jgi:hypothetical protein